MARLRCLLAAFAILFSCEAEARLNPFFYKVGSVDGKHSYYVVTVGISRQEEDPLPAWDGIGRAVLSRAHRWLIQHYKESYPDIDPARFDEMARSDDPADGVSQSIVVFKDAALTQVAATMRFTFTDKEHPDLPMEGAHGLKWKVPRPEPYVAEHTFAILGNKPLRRKDVLGDVIEVKNFAAEKGLSDELVPLLFLHAERSDFGQKPPAYRRYADKLMREHPEVGVGGGIYTAKYTLMCDERMKPYYERLGFKLIPGAPTVNGTVGMEIDREGFTAIWFKHFGARHGAATALEGPLEYFHFRLMSYDECSTMLGSPASHELGPALRGLIDESLQPAH